MRRRNRLEAIWDNIVVIIASLLGFIDEHPATLLFFAALYIVIIVSILAFSPH